MPRSRWTGRLKRVYTACPRPNSTNSDDPLPFGTDITGEYRVLLRDMGFSLRDVGTFAKNAFAASLLDPATQATLCAEVDQVIA
jgi:adenosine deaminase